MATAGPLSGHLVVEPAGFTGDTGDPFRQRDIVSWPDVVERLRKPVAALAVRVVAIAVPLDALDSHMRTGGQVTGELQVM